jgi:putative methyltransferase (TIGR04325 family)
MELIEKIFPDFASALAECGDGYNDSDIAKVITFKTAEMKDGIGMLWPEQLTNTILAVGIAGANLTQRPLRVLDFGGGCGVHYFAVKSAFVAPLHWAIVESRIMVNNAKAISAGQFEAYDQITAAVSALGCVDLVHASSTIQYVPEPTASLDALIGLGAPYFMLARFPIWTEQPIVGVQTTTLESNGIGPMPPDVSNRTVKYPITFLNIDDVMAKFEKAYRLVLALPSPSSEYKVRGERIAGTTLIFRRNTSD